MGKILVVNGALFKARLLKTGQVTSYGSGTGVDDGALSKGIAKAYVILTTGRYAGTTTITLNGKDDVHSNNCVRDRNTGLMWSRYPSASVGPASDGKIPWTTNAGGEGIFPYVAAANAAQLAGYSDWRIPNIFELISLAIVKSPSIAPDPTAFPSWPGDWMQCSTSSPTGNPNTQFISTLTTYGVYQAIEKVSNYPVVLVRGG